MENKNLNEVKDLNENEVEKVAGGADTSRDERIKKAIDFASNLPKFYYETHEVKCRRCRQPMKVCGGVNWIPICDDCQAGRNTLDRMKKSRQELKETKQPQTSPETKS